MRYLVEELVPGTEQFPTVLKLLAAGVCIAAVLGLVIRIFRR